MFVFYLKTINLQKVDAYLFNLQTIIPDIEKNRNKSFKSFIDLYQHQKVEKNYNGKI